ncbi:hypothetical protein [Bifidobacterium sp. SO1]|uniref:hypothetical protein n=1 Tax=Bifidobacterium sp. SO1 TaxID=2809029 RepID=UPI001BDD669E|nr:hypothetical protein [Bifidobacterium sp. SO1]MBT1161850.1 hypothetical protein [Bifidobacterium sp. SO1]
MVETARIVFMTGGSGGIGKSTGARMLAHTLGLHGYRTCLVDGNAGQQSQRMFLRIPETKALEYARTDGMMDALVKPLETGGAFALLCGPADTHSLTANDDYLEAILSLRSMCDMIIVDADRIDGRQWNDPHSFAGRVMRPMVFQAGARIIFRIGQTGSQLDDGLACLDAIRCPKITLAIGVAGVNVKPKPAHEWKDLLNGLAEYGGTDQWDDRSTLMLTPGEGKRMSVGWPKGMEPDWLRRAAAWCGADPKRFERRREGSWWPWTRR